MIYSMKIKRIHRKVELLTFNKRFFRQENIREMVRERKKIHFYKNSIKTFDSLSTPSLVTKGGAGREKRVHVYTE